MGSGDKFNKDSNEEWSSSEIIDGVKVLVNPTDTRGNLPTYAKDSTMYARRDNSTGEIIQLRIYGEQVDGIRQPIMDIDLWGSDERVYLNISLTFRIISDSVLLGVQASSLFA